MKKPLIMAGVIILALAMGVGAAAFISPSLAPTQAAQPSSVSPQVASTPNAQSGSQVLQTPLAPGNNWSGNGRGPGMMGNWDGTPQQGTTPQNGWYGHGPGMMGNWGGTPQQGTMPQNGWNGRGPGMMGGYGGRHMMGDWGWNGSANPNTSAQRLTMEQAVSAGNLYAADYYGDTVEIAEIMEFDANFYLLFVETETGRGAFELLVDPYNGFVSPEPGPNMMWNLKYGHMGSYPGDNSIALEDARLIAQQSLVANWPAAQAELEGEGASFYGYYTFDYAIDGQMAGMLSVNGLNGQVFYHTWHGTFIQEKEYHE